jgi:hypothetical protein
VSPLNDEIFLGLIEAVVKLLPGFALAALVVTITVLAQRPAGR